MSEVVLSEGSTISAITIEYDIQDDQPEGTDVFSLDSSSLAVIEKLVKNRYPALSQINTRTIAEFSGGNARIALALANTVKNTETVAGLSDADLFTRLFEQRHGHDASLLLIAQACSLVYSFQGETLSGDGAELPVLGNLIGKSVEGLDDANEDIKGLVNSVRVESISRSVESSLSIVPRDVMNMSSPPGRTFSSEAAKK